MFRRLFLPLSLLSILFVSSCTITVSENVPSQPTGLTASYWGSSVSLNWSDVDFNNFWGSYDVFRGSSADNLAFLTNVPLSYTYDYSPLTGTNVYAVRGTNSAGVSAFSSTATLYISTETLLTNGAIHNGNLTAVSQEDLFYFNASTSANYYAISFADVDSTSFGKTGRISISVYQEGNTNALYLDQVTESGTPVTTKNYTPSSSGKVYIKVAPYNSLSSSLGTYYLSVEAK